MIREALRKHLRRDAVPAITILGIVVVMLIGGGL